MRTPRWRFRRMSRVWRLAFPPPPISLAYADLVMRQNYLPILVEEIHRRSPLLDLLRGES